MANLVDVGRMREDIGRVRVELNRLADIEKVLNDKLGDPRYRKDFFSDPVKLLSEEGIKITEENEQSLVELFNSVNVPENARLYLGIADKTVDPLSQSDWGIGISITIPF